MILNVVATGAVTLFPMKSLWTVWLDSFNRATERRSWRMCTALRGNYTRPVSWCLPLRLPLRRPHLGSLTAAVGIGCATTWAILFIPRALHSVSLARATIYWSWRSMGKWCSTGAGREASGTRKIRSPSVPVVGKATRRSRGFINWEITRPSTATGSRSIRVCRSSPRRSWRRGRARRVRIR